MMRNYFPFLNWIGELNARTIRSDLLAGFTGAIVVLPQGVAFALIAGMPPINGLYTAMILPIVAALFGSSKHLISGPTTAISIVVFSAVSPYTTQGTPEFVQIAIVVTLVAGLIQLALGLARLGALVNFVSHSVIIGFTAGAALLIGASQLKHLLGIEVSNGASFGQTLWQLGSGISQTNMYVLTVGLVTLIFAIIIKRLYKPAPNMFLAMIIGSIVAYYIGSEHGIATIGELPTGLPPFSMPIIDLQQMKGLFPNAFAIALLGLIEAVAISRSIATKSGQRIDGNQEFVGQGLSNIVGSFFSCYAGSGSFTRTGINYSSGAVTPMSAIFAAGLLMIIVSFAAPLAAYLPIPAMAGIILLVAYNLIDFHHIKKILRTSKRESSVLLITLIATLTLELEYAIYLGILFSLIFYLNQTSNPRFVEIAPDDLTKKRMFRNLAKYSHIKPCPQLMIYRVEGSLFFGAVESVADEMHALFNRKENHLLIVANNINLIDTSGAEFLENVVKKWR
ncbi:MAG: SulP family inorganic anion transporter, partial [Cytophagales bacterium]|nr:SulP family inorganic anion transporter [Cytophagales bacterium]